MSAQRSHWWPVVGFVFVSSANQMAWLTFAPVATGAARSFAVSTSTIGVLSEVFPLVYVLGAMPAARALDKSLRGWLAGGALLSALGTVVRLGGGGRSGFVWVMAGQVLVAAAQPLLLNAVVALARRYLVPADVPTGIAVGSAGTFLGFVLAFVVGGTIGSGHIGALLQVDVAYALAGAAVLAVALWRSPLPPGAIPGQSGAGLGELRRLWHDPVMRGLIYLVFVGFGAFVALVTWAQPLLQPAGVTTGTADGLLTLMVLAGVATSALLPTFIARRGRQLFALVAGGVATICGCLLLAVAPGVTSAAVALVVTGLLLLPGMPIMLEIAERVSTAGAAAGAGVLWLAGNAGGIVVSVVVGAVEGTPWLAFVALAGVIALAAPPAARLRGRLAVGVQLPSGAPGSSTS